jgi:hypothetical protein
MLNIKKAVQASRYLASNFAEMVEIRYNLQRVDHYCIIRFIKFSDKVAHNNKN